jgi:hypothetical protein
MECNFSCFARISFCVKKLLKMALLRVKNIFREIVLTKISKIENGQLSEGYFIKNLKENKFSQ